MDRQDEPTFALTKEWRDGEPGIELVEIRYACAPTGEPPDWDVAEEAMVLVSYGDESPTYRAATLDLPCGWAGADYDLHYYFVVVQHGRQRTLPVVCERITSRELAYHDPNGRFQAVGLQWSVGEAGAPNYTPLDAALPVYPSPRVTMGQSVISKLATVSRVRIWGPRGATISYAFCLRPLSGDPGEVGKWWSGSDGRLAQLTL